MTGVTADQARALREIAALLGDGGVVPAEGSEAERYLVDHRRLYRGEAAMIARPANVEQVGQVVARCAGAGIAVVPQGGNTGYCGGATPMAPRPSLVLSLECLRRVRSIDPVDYTMTVEAGVVLADVQHAADAAGMLFPLSLGSEGSCQIGGNLATNAGGTAVLRFGNARELVLGLEVVLADGTRWDGLRRLRKDNAGYDLKQLFLGSEGTLGIITAAVLKLFPKPVQQQTALVAVESVEAACELLAAARRETADAVTSFEYLPRFAVELVCQHIDGARDPLDRAYGHYVLLELSAASSGAGLEQQLRALLEAGMAAGWVRDAVVAQSGPQRARLWQLRECVPEAQRHEGGSYKHDVSVPTGQLAQFLAEGLAAAAAAAPEARPCVYGHIGDGNLHFNFLAPRGTGLAEYFDRRGAALSDAVYGAASALGGSVCAEHGVGQLKRDLLRRYADPVSMRLMATLKQALDPLGVLNPDKVLQAPPDRTDPG